MSPTGPALLAALGMATVAALSGWLLPAQGRAPAVGFLLAASGVAGLLAGLAALGGDGWHAEMPQLLPLAGVRLDVDALSGWFLLLVGAVTVAVGVYTIGYPGHG